MTSGPPERRPADDPDATVVTGSAVETEPNGVNGAERDLSALALVARPASRPTSEDDAELSSARTALAETAPSPTVAERAGPTVVGTGARRRLTVESLLYLVLIAAVVQSFHAFPVSAEPMAFLHTVQMHTLGAEVFKLGVWIALPIMAMLLFVNLVLGVISRVAQQMNIFAIGFPITLSVGLLGVVVTLPLLEKPFTMAVEQMLSRFQ